MKMLKTTLFILAGFFVTSTATAQLSGGGGLGYGVDIDQLSAFARGEIQFAEQWRVAATFNFFIREDVPENNVGYTAINLDGHYILIDSGSFQLYGIGGANVTFVKVGGGFLGLPFQISEADTEFGLNLGGGARLLEIGDFAPFAEVKYILGGVNQLVVFLGAVYIFNN